MEEQTPTDKTNIRTDSNQESTGKATSEAEIKANTEENYTLSKSTEVKTTEGKPYKPKEREVVM